ncbi:Dihydrofolate reductase [candidate division SR1 bacterium Aalborg_AAW-1]|nr:Dihydrofolate reductase [candidate division SR1 bacterium Aalborg_AAW-1]
MLVLISAMSQNRVIGTNNQLPWHISADLQRFKKITSGHIVVMGRKTYESIGELLPHRENHIISSTLHNSDLVGIAEGTSGKIFDSLKAWKERYNNHNYETVYIIGGGTLYEALLPDADRIELTLIDGNINGDVYFPEFEDTFKLTESESHSDGTYSFQFLRYEKI